MTMAKVLLNPNGSMTSRPKREAYWRLTTAYTFPGSLSTGCFRMAVSAVPVYST